MDVRLAFQDAQPFKLTVDQFHELVEQGIIDEGPNVELIEGMIVQMSPQASAHTVVVSQLAFRLHDALKAIGSPHAAFVAPTIAIPPRNAPEPDIAVGVSPVPSRDFFGLAAMKLLVEVSHTTLHRDLGVKRSIYARSGVPEYWVIDVKKAVVHRFWQPQDGVYQAEPPIPLAGPLASLTMPELVVDGGGIL